MAPIPDDPRPSRRRVLRASGAALATGLSTLGAGCSGLPPLGTQVRYGSVEVPDANAPVYRDWLPAPTAFPADAEERDGYDAMVYAPPPADAPEWAGANVARRTIASETDYVGVHVDDVEVAFTTAMGGGGAAALIGDVDRGAVRDALADTSYEPVASDGSRGGSDAGYDLYARADVDRAVGVLDDALAFGNGPKAAEIVRTVAAAGRGRVPRYHERDANVDALVTGTGLRRWVWLWPGGVDDDSTGGGVHEDTVGWATGFDRDDAGAYYVSTWLFPRGYDPTERAVERSLKTERPPGLPNATDVSAVDVTVRGRVATIAMFLRPETFREVVSVDRVRVPHATWGVAFDPDADRLTFRHEAGDPVRTAALRVDGAGLGPGSATPDVAAVGDRVEPGEAVRVSTAAADPGATVRLVYEPPDADVTTLLFSYALP